MKNIVNVSTKEEMNEALMNRVPSIHVVGELAATFRKKERVKKVSRAALVLTALAFAAIPFTGGASSLLAGATCMTATAAAGSVAVSTTELIVLVGGTVALAAMLKGAKVTIHNDGSVTVEPRYADC